MTLTETGELMALIAEEHPKFLETADPERRLKLWGETFRNVPFDAVELAVKRVLAENPYTPKLSDVVKSIRDASTPKLPPAKRPVTEWERKSLEWMIAWNDAHERELHSQGKLTAVECKNLGMTCADYCAQFA